MAWNLKGVCIMSVIFEAIARGWPKDNFPRLNLLASHAHSTRRNAHLRQSLSEISSCRTSRPRLCFGFLCKLAYYKNSSGMGSPTTNVLEDSDFFCLSFGHTWAYPFKYIYIYIYTYIYIYIYIYTYKVVTASWVVADHRLWTRNKHITGKHLFGWTELDKR